jgi:hypothetical protein
MFGFPVPNVIHRLKLVVCDILCRHGLKPAGHPTIVTLGALLRIQLAVSDRDSKQQFMSQKKTNAA